MAETLGDMPLGKRLETEAKIRCAFLLLRSAVSDLACYFAGDDDTEDLEPDLVFSLPEPMVAFKESHVSDEVAAWFVPGEEGQTDELARAVAIGIRAWKEQG